MIQLQVIPLVQTFGHMEFILKLEQFSHLRDVAEMPESICPCHDQTMSLIRTYIDQVMSIHKHVKYLHIGCDEVFHLGECAPCLSQVGAKYRNEYFSGSFELYSRPLCKPRMHGLSPEVFAAPKRCTYTIPL